MFLATTVYNVSGCDREGSGRVHITNQVTGLETAIIADIDLERPKRTLEAIDVPGSAICVINAPGETVDALGAGVIVTATPTPSLLCWRWKWCSKQSF